MIRQTFRATSFGILLLAAPSAWAEHHDKKYVNTADKVPGFELGMRLSANVPAVDAVGSPAGERSGFQRDDRPQRKVRVVYPVPSQ